MTSACDVSNLLPMVEEQKYPDFAKRLNELMTIKGISVTQLKSLVGVTYEMARRYTIGAAKPRVSVMSKLALALGVSASYLEYGVGDREECKEMASIPNPTKPDVYRIEVLDLSVSAGPGPICFQTMLMCSTPLSSQLNMPVLFSETVLRMI